MSMNKHLVALKITAAIAALILSSGNIFAQEGSLDPAFSLDGKAFVSFDFSGSTLADVAYDMVIQPDGRTVLAGSASRDSGDHRYCVLARFTTGGILDASFDGDGKVEFYVGDEQQQFNAVALQGSRIIAAGWHRFTDLQGDINYDFHVARYTSGGSLDSSFGTSGSVTISFDDISTGKWDVLEDIVIQPDNKIVLVGRCRASSGDYDIAIARLTENGVLDTSFDGDGRRVIWYDAGGFNNDEGEGVALQPDGKIVIVSTIDISSDDTDLAVDRLNTDGSSDCTFGGSCSGVRISFDAGSPTYLFDFANDIAMMGRKIVVVGTIDGPTGNKDMAFARLNANGTLDTTFGESNSGKRRLPIDNGDDNYDGAGALAVRGDGRIIMAGFARNSAGNFDMAVVRLDVDGSVDINFGDYGQKIVAFDYGGDMNDVAMAVGIQTDGKIVAAGRNGAEGSATDMDMAAIRLSQNAILFGDGLETNDFEAWSSTSP